MAQDKDKWHVDPAAGVRFPVPFTGAQIKTAAQVKALILERPEASIPAAVTYTSGVYAKDGLPFVLVWTRASEQVPTAGEVEQLATASPVELEAAYGVKNLHFDAATGRGVGEADVKPLQAKVLVQLAKGGTVQVGYYYSDPADAAGFDLLAAGFEIDPGKRLALNDLPRGKLAWASAAALAALIVLGAAAGLRRSRRRRRAKV